MVHEAVGAPSDQRLMPTRVVETEADQVVHARSRMLASSRLFYEYMP